MSVCHTETYVVQRPQVLCRPQPAWAIQERFLPCRRPIRSIAAEPLTQILSKNGVTHLEFLSEMCTGPPKSGITASQQPGGTQAEDQQRREMIWKCPMDQ